MTTLAANYRIFNLPWTPDEDEQQRLRKTARVALLVFATFGILVPLLPVSERPPPPALPEEVVKLILEPPPPPPPPPEVKKPEPKPEINPEIKPKPVPKPVDRKAEAHGAARSAASRAWPSLSLGRSFGAARRLRRRSGRSGTSGVGLGDAHGHAAPLTGVCPAGRWVALTWER